MTPTIRVDDEVMGRLKELAIEHEVIFGSPNQVLRKVLGLDGVGEAAATDSTVDDGREPAGYPTSPNPSLQQLLDMLRPELKSMINRLEEDGAGRFVSRPENFVTVKVQERVQDLAFTVYGRSEDFGDLPVSFEIKPYRSGSYSSFKVNKGQQIAGATLVLRRALQLWEHKRRR